MSGFKGFSFTSKKAPPVSAARTAPQNVELITSFDGTEASQSEKNEEKLIIHQSEEFLKSRPRQLLEARSKELNKPSTSSDDPLHAKAVQELIDGTKPTETEDLNKKVIGLSVNPDKLVLEGAAEPTLDDYEAVKIEDFGLALLRGMGYKDPVGEKKKPFEEDGINVRARGLGLGAEKLMQKPQVPKDASGNELQIKRNSKIKILAGPQKDFYGIIEGFEGCNRVTVKLALNSMRVSVNESIILPVTETEFSKQATVSGVTKLYGLDLGTKLPESTFTGASSSSSQSYDKYLTVSSSSISSSKNSSQIKRNAKVKISGGPHENNYGIVEGFEDYNKITVKLALSGKKVSVNEECITPVSDADYNKCSKVINHRRFDSLISRKSSTFMVPQAESKLYGPDRDSGASSSSSRHNERHGGASSSSSSSSRGNRDKPY